MFCNKCGKDIPDNSEFCNFCGNKLKNVQNTETEPKKNNGCLVVILVVMALLILISLIPESETKSGCASCPSVQEMEDAICKYQKADIIVKFIPALNSVYISEPAVQQMEFNDLEVLGYITACYSAHAKGNNLAWVEIYSNRTHKRVAKYSTTSGLKLDE